MRRTAITLALAMALGAAAVPAAANDPDVLHSENVGSLAALRTTEWAHKAIFTKTHAYVGTASGGKIGGIDVFKILQGAPYLQRVGRYGCSGANFEGSLTRWRNFLFQPVEAWANRAAEDKQGPYDPCFPEEGGIRVLDISKPSRPQPAGFIPLTCGSHNITPYEWRGKLFIYNSNGCSGQDPVSTGVGGVGPTFEIEVIGFNPRNPSRSRIVSKPSLSPMAGCHDITVFPAKDLAACVGVGQSALLDISEPRHPFVLSTVQTGHYNADMAQFTWDGRYMAIAEVENRGLDGTHFCHAEQDPRGNYYFYDITDPTNIKQVGSYKVPHVPPMWSPNALGGYRCHASHFGVLPMKDAKRYVATTSWANGGVSVVDFSDPTDPKEIAFWQPQWGHFTWFAYWFNGRVYAGQNNTEDDSQTACQAADPCSFNAFVRVLKVDGLGRRDVHFYRDGYVPQVQPAYLSSK